MAKKALDGKAIFMPFHLKKFKPWYCLKRILHKFCLNDEYCPHNYLIL